MRLTFPAKELIDIYRQSQSRLSVVSGLSFSVPVDVIENDYGLTPPPYMLMVKTSKLNEFFAKNSLPDNKESFYATYSAASGKYSFSSMRQYIINLIEKETISDDDLDFTIVPVDLTLESNNNNSNNYYYYYYGSSSSNSTTYTVTKCTPYIAKPAMCRLRLDEAQTVFTYSIQQMK